jgi:hypothetical protein
MHVGMPNLHCSWHGHQYGDTGTPRMVSSYTSGALPSDCTTGQYDVVLLELGVLHYIIRQ